MLCHLGLCPLTCQRGNKQKRAQGQQGGNQIERRQPREIERRAQDPRAAADAQVKAKIEASHGPPGTAGQHGHMMGD